MKVLLLEDVKGVGKKGAVVEVKVGYGNNFLIKNKKALLADEETIKQYEQDERSAKARLDSHNKELVELAHKIERLDISIAHKCGFESLYAFSRAFKSLVGMSPRDYRKQNKS